MMIAVLSGCCNLAASQIESGMEFSVRGVSIKKCKHDTFWIKTPSGIVIVIDPFKVDTEKDSKDRAHIVLCSHEHDDHYSPKDITKVASQYSSIFVGGNPDLSKLGELESRVKKVAPQGLFVDQGIKIQTTFAYNVDKFRKPGVLYHPKEANGVGFIITADGVKIYFAGDTDKIPEMARLRNIDVAMLPVSGKYVMTPDEAAQVVKAIQPKTAIPMHYGEIVGSKKNAKEFEKTCKKLGCLTEIVVL